MPKKLRSACDFCHQTKVKCSGGNPCSGCANLYIECVYSESNRIGRPKGSRNKKTIERVKQYQAENEARQRAMMVGKEAHEEDDLQQSSSSPSSRQHLPATSNSTSPSSPVSPMHQDLNMNGSRDMYNFAQEQDSILTPADQVYTMFPQYEVPPRDLSDFEFPQTPADQPWIASQSASANSLLFDIESANYLQARLDAENAKGTPMIPAPTVETGFPDPMSVRSLSVSSTPSASTMGTSALMTPALSSVPSRQSPPRGHSCSCLHDQASLLSRLALKAPDQTGPMELDAVLETAQQAIKSWDAFLQCRPCSMELLRSNIDSYLVLTSSMKIILQILYDQFKEIENSAAAQMAGSSPVTSSSISDSMQRSRSWSLGLYETNKLEGQLVSATLLVNIANGVVALSGRLCEMTNGADMEVSTGSLERQHQQSSMMDLGSAGQAVGAPAHLSGYGVGAGPGCADLSASETMAGFGLKFLQHTAHTVDRQARSFKEDISARIKLLV